MSHSNNQAGKAAALLSLSKGRGVGACHCHWVLSVPQKGLHIDPKPCPEEGMASDVCVIRRFPNRLRLSIGPGTELPHRLEVLEIEQKRWKAMDKTSSDTHTESGGEIN